MAHEQHRSTLLAKLAYPPEAAALELGVAHREHLVHDQDVGLDMSCDGEGKPQVHPRRVPLERRVEEAFDAGKLDDVVEPPPDLATRQPENDAVQIDVLASRQLGMESGPHLEQRADATSNAHAADRRSDDACDRFQERRLPGAVPTDDPDAVALLDLEVHVAERPDLVCSGSFDRATAETSRHGFAQRQVGVYALPQAIALAQPVRDDRGAHQITSANLRSARRK